ncbi:arylesterase [Amaricoccus sp. B4]|uniref:arylesterase n=1 Tax=Amaricoccus sp. B4 TaxID=3368557 RepID=UPI0037168D6D
MRRLRNLAALLLAMLLWGGAAVAEVRILAFGDSLTQGHGLSEEDGFVPQLQAWLRANGAPDAVVLNAGVSGDTTAGGLARIGWALGEKPDAVIVELGANDMLRGLPLAEIRSNLEAILAQIAAEDLPVLLAGVPVPSNYGADYRTAFEAIFTGLAAEHDAILYPSFLAGMTEGRSLPEALKLMQADGIHPNAEGVRENVARIGPVVLALIAEARH